MTLTKRNEIRRAGLLRATRYKYNVFQLTKRVRRATRHGGTFLKVITRHSGLTICSRHSQTRLNFAHFGLQHAERALRIAKYYCAAFNIPMRDDSFTLK